MPGTAGAGRQGRGHQTREAANGLYFRLYNRALPELAAEIFNHTDFDVGDYERLHRSEMDDAESWLSQKLAQPKRRLP